VLTGILWYAGDGMTTEAPTTESPRRSWLAVRWRRFALAVTFLTRLPLPLRGEVTPDDLRASMGWYPAVGAALGLLGWGLYLGGARLFAGGEASLLAAALAVVLLETATGALHLDGLMDTCDGAGSGAPRARALEIMKDSRVGAMGVFGAVAVLLVKVAALAALPPATALLPLLAGWAAARALPLLNLRLFPYARAQGTGGMFTTGRAPHALPLALLTVAAAGWLAGRVDGLLLVALALAIPLFIQARIAAKLGGLTGDVYGCGIELSEVTAVLLGCVFARWLP